MKKEIAIKCDAEQQRILIYRFVKAYFDEGYTFTNRFDYEWFVEYVVNQDKEISILGYSYFTYDDYCMDKLIITIVYVHNYELHLHYIDLINQNDGFKLPTFKKGEN